MDIFSLEPGLAIWTWIAFGLLLFILSKYVYPTLFKNIKDREEAIGKAVDNAREIEKRLDAIEVEHEKIIGEARRESDQILRQIREDADKLKKELFEKAEREATLIMEETKERIAEERKVAIESMKKDLVELICDSSEKIIGRSFVKEEDKTWTRELVDKL